MVGDDDQAIYGWRGADVSNILDFNRDFPDARVTRLEENYRSSQPILDISNDIIVNNSNRMSKKLWTKQKEGLRPRLYTLRTDLDEAATIAGIIESISVDTSLSEIPVLYRANSQSRLIEEALLSAKIPYRVYGGTSFFDRREIKDTLAYLRFIGNPYDEVSFLRLINTPARGIGEKSVQKLMAYRDESIKELTERPNILEFFLENQDWPLTAKANAAFKTLLNLLQGFHLKARKSIDLGLLFEDVLEKTGLRESFDEEDRLLGSGRIENLAELKGSLLRYQQGNSDGLLADYLQEITLYTNNEEKPSDEKSVNLMTVHNAKGLEFDSVFIVGLDEDVIPHYFAARDGNIEEERRLLYVAITRARRRLYLTRSETRFTQGWQQPTQASRFLQEIDATHLEAISGAAKSIARPSPTMRKPRPNIKPGTGFKNLVDTKSIKKKSTSAYSPGDRVIHSSFGGGRVLRIEGSGPEAKIHIFFDDKKTRKFLVSFTKLEKK